MKRIVFSIILQLFIVNFALSQKFGYIDADFILKKMPEYPKVRTEMDKAVTDWNESITKRFAEVEKMEKIYLEEEILLTDEMKAERLEKIEVKRNEARAYQNQIFGFEGEYFKKNEDLLKPVREELYKAVKKVANEKKLQIVFDKSSDLIMIFHEIRHDYTDFVLEELGLGEKEENEDK